jgi:hypothetical protein
MRLRHQNSAIALPWCCMQQLTSLEVALPRGYVGNCLPPHQIHLLHWPLLHVMAKAKIQLGDRM